ncbi:unnamed protein product [Protopolystoma xenopodis]|uniref:Uncharacterized protein n=1 Tax=Protopolystoma xenopodis TaxID=117903 RepID=A0A448WWI1_9PLAT|nr:unnamed protein product [Protopolystoma xenopodis]
MTSQRFGSAGLTTHMLRHQLHRNRPNHRGRDSEQSESVHGESATRICRAKLRLDEPTNETPPDPRLIADSASGHTRQTGRGDICRPGQTSTSRTPELSAAADASSQKADRRVSLFAPELRR